MILEAEIRREAARLNVDPMVIDLDYSLGWFLLCLANSGETAQNLRFKGGTSLRKCYFGDYRFSEDLDFTATGLVIPEKLMALVSEITARSAEQDGPDFSAAPARLEMVDDDYGSESYQLWVYYRGPLRWGGSPRAIRLDITRREKLILPPSSRAILHPYSDKGFFVDTQIDCYPLEEIMAEKLRAVGGQRRFAISRDVYDLFTLSQKGVSIDRVIPLLAEKFKARGIDLSQLSRERLAQRRAEFQIDWDRRLSYLVKIQQLPSFESAWEHVLQMIDLAQKALQNPDPTPDSN